MRCISIGSEYQLHVARTFSKFSNPLVIHWPSSHVTKFNANAQNTKTVMVAISITFQSSAHYIEKTVEKLVLLQLSLGT